MGRWWAFRARAFVFGLRPLASKMKMASGGSLTVTAPCRPDVWRPDIAPSFAGVFSRFIVEIISTVILAGTTINRQYGPNQSGQGQSIATTRQSRCVCAGLSGGSLVAAAP
jgi:hypothetical protein